MMDIDPSEPTPALILANTQVHWLRGTATPINTQCNSTDHLASTGTHAGHTLSPNSALQECGDPLYQYLISLSQSMPSVRAASVHGHLLQCTFKSISTKFKATLGLFRFCSHFQSFFKNDFLSFPSPYSVYHVRFLVLLFKMLSSIRSQMLIVIILLTYRRLMGCLTMVQVIYFCLIFNIHSTT